MIRVETAAAARRPPMINTMRGEFEALIAGKRYRFDTRLSTVASIEAACGDRAVVDVLNGIIVGRRVRDQIPLLGAALACADPAPEDPTQAAAQATVGEAEAFILALVVALGFKVGAREGRGGTQPPLDDPASGGNGGPSPSVP